MTQGIESGHVEQRNPEIGAAVDDVLFLAQFTIGYSRVLRAPRMPDGRRESDVEHSFELALIAPTLAERFAPQLDIGKIVLFSIVHDMPEYYVGDTWTFAISDEDRVIKDQNEAAATERLVSELPRPWCDLLLVYEAQEVPEARFVRLVDKLMPSTICLFDELETSTFISDYDVTSKDFLLDAKHKKSVRLHQQFPEYTDIIDLSDMLDDMDADHYFPEV